MDREREVTKKMKNERRKGKHDQEENNLTYYKGRVMEEEEN